MKNLYLRVSLALVFMLTGVLTADWAMADDRSRGGGDKGGKHGYNDTYDRYDGHRDRDRRDSYDRQRYDGGRKRYFSDRHRVYIHDYYGKHYRKGGCPPGLYKKHNGCRPPGHAKRWAVGRVLPRDVIFYDLEPSVLVQLGPAPSRHRFVRVAQDILLIAVGTGLVVDAIDDLSWEFDH